MKNLFAIISICLLSLSIVGCNNDTPFGCSNKTPKEVTKTINENLPELTTPEVTTPPKMEATATEDGIKVDITSPKFGDPITKAVTLIWDANTEEDLAGYKLYYGNAPRPVDVEGPDDPNPYTTIKEIPDAVAVTYALDLPIGSYYFTLTAYDTSNNESGFSNEVFAALLDTPTSFTVTFNWDTYPREDLIDGFKIYYGNTNRGGIVSPYEEHPYTETIIIPGASLVNYSTEIPSGEYYFTLTAYNNGNPIGYQDSYFSNEVYASIPITPVIRFPLTPETPIVTPII